MNVTISVLHNRKDDPFFPWVLTGIEFHFDTDFFEVLIHLFNDFWTFQHTPCRH